MSQRVVNPLSGLSAVIVAVLFLSSCKDVVNEKGKGQSCLTHSECALGLVCDCATRTCLPPNESRMLCDLPDAGWPDAAAVVQDAAVQDAAELDAVVDGGAEDAQEPDAEAPDAAEPDATEPDADTPDAS